MKNILYIRTDSSSIIGTGHVYRCLNFADKLKNKYKIEFICKNFNNNLINIINQKYKVNIIDIKNDNCNLDKKTWLGESWENDLNKTINIINNNNIDKNYKKILIDHYAIPYEWEFLIKNYVNSIILFSDDLINKHYVDIYINQHLLNNSKNYKIAQNLNKNNCKIFIGQEYIILNDYLLKSKNNKIINKNIKNILIFFGGSDHLNYTRKTILILNSLNITDINYYIIVGKSNSDKLNDLKNIISNNFKIINGLSQKKLIDLYINIDIAIGSIGCSSFERILMKIPSINIQTAENQKYIKEFLIEHNFSILLSNDNFNKSLIDNFINLLNINTYNFYLENCKKYSDKFISKIKDIVDYI